MEKTKFTTREVWAVPQLQKEEVVCTEAGGTSVNSDSAFFVS